MTSSNERGQLGERHDYEQWAAAVVEAVELRRPSAAEGHCAPRPARHRPPLSDLFVRLRPIVWGAARPRS